MEKNLNVVIGEIEQEAAETLVPIIQAALSQISPSSKIEAKFIKLKTLSEW
jgi:hypothetical protein